VSGSLGEVVEFVRVITNGQQTPEAKIDLGADDAATAGHFSAVGDDSYPLLGDLVYLGDGTGAGSAEILGYQDPTTLPKATAGEKRIYSRSGPGVVACEVHLKSDGTVVVSNTLGRLELLPDGNVTVTTPLGSYGVATHVHGSPFGPTTAPIPNT
jgi:hypothetical protein